MRRRFGTSEVWALKPNEDVGKSGFQLRSFSLSSNSDWTDIGIVINLASFARPHWIISSPRRLPLPWHCSSTIVQSPDLFDRTSRAERSTAADQNLTQQQEQMKWDLEAARIKSVSEDAFYIADFITEAEEEWLLQKIISAPLPRWTHLSHRRLQTWPSALTKSNTLIASPLPSWLVAPIVTPHFDSLGIFAHAPHRGPNHVLINEYRPGQGIMPHEDGAAYYPLVATVSLGAPIVLGLYEKEAEISPDTNNNKDTHADWNDNDGDDDNDDDACGLVGEGRRSRRPKHRILQERRSLLVTRGRIYRDYLHGIAETDRDEGLNADSICNWDLLREPERYQCGSYERETRISLTYRDVLKVAKLGNTMKFLGGR